MFVKTKRIHNLGALSPEEMAAVDAVESPSIKEAAPSFLDNMKRVRFTKSDHNVQSRMVALALQDVAFDCWERKMGDV